MRYAGHGCDKLLLVHSKEGRLMKTQVGSKVHPWYKGCHEWGVKGIAGLEKPIKYDDPMRGSHTGWQPQKQVVK